MTKTFNPRSLFLGHGAPTLALSSHPSNMFLQQLGSRLAAPSAVIVISPHSAGTGFAVKAPPRFRTWHDFRGFPKALYALRYEPVGDAALADRVAAALTAAGLPTANIDDDRLDHGAWVPLSLMWPDADLPVVQVTIRPDAGPASHWALGEALAPLLDNRVLLICSGSLTHNLSEIDPREGAPAADWAHQFAQWMDRRLQSRDIDALLDYRRRAPEALRAHPHEDHLLPLFTAAAAGASCTRLHDSTTYGSISMAAYAFD